MKRLLGIMLVSVLAPASVLAQDPTDCGTYSNHNTSHQFGDYNWLEYIVETRRQVDLLCALFSSVGVEAYVVGVAGSAASASDTYTASVRRQVPVPDWGRYQTSGQHWRYWLGVRYSNGSTASHADIYSRTEEEVDCSIYDSGGSYYVWDGSSCVEYLGSPLIVDAARDGYHLTSAAEGVLFDLDADGTPERTAWTRAESDDAFLAMDRNGNGRIDDGSELFGNRTPAHAGQADVTALNGFEALRFLQGPSYGVSTIDRQIDSADAAFARLLLWRDANHDGLSTADELTPLGATVAAIGTDYKEKRRVDRFGNQFRQKGQIAWTDGETGILYDIWLRRGQ